MRKTFDESLGEYWKLCQFNKTRIYEFVAVMFMLLCVAEWHVVERLRSTATWWWSESQAWKSKLTEVHI